MTEQAAGAEQSAAETAPEARGPLTWGGPRHVLSQLGMALVVALCWGLVLAIVIEPHPAGRPPVVSEGEMITWDTHIYPIIQRNCIICHGRSGGLDLTTLEHALAGGIHGPAVISGNAASSLLYRLLQGPVENIPSMPLGRDRLPQETIDLIGRWIEQLPPGG